MLEETKVNARERAKELESPREREREVSAREEEEAVGRRRRRKRISPTIVVYAFYLASLLLILPKIMRNVLHS